MHLNSAQGVPKTASTTTDFIICPYLPHNPQSSSDHFHHADTEWYTVQCAYDLKIPGTHYERVSSQNPESCYILSKKQLAFTCRHSLIYRISNESTGVYRKRYAQGWPGVLASLTATAFVFLNFLDFFTLFALWQRSNNHDYPSSCRSVHRFDALKRGSVIKTKSIKNQPVSILPPRQTPLPQNTISYSQHKRLFFLWMNKEQTRVCQHGQRVVHSCVNDLMTSQYVVWSVSGTVHTMYVCICTYMNVRMNRTDKLCYLADSSKE